MVYVPHLIGDTDLAADAMFWPNCMVDLAPSQCPSLARVPETAGITRIGSKTEVRPFAIVYRSARIGSACLLGEHSIVREGAVVGDRCIIGQYACVSYDAELADEVKVQNGTLIADGWKIGRETFIGVNVTTMSDKRRDLVDYEFKGSCPTIIGSRCIIGSGAVILPGLRIGDNVVIGAGALVTEDVPDGATVLGQPARMRDRRGYEIPHGNEARAAHSAMYGVLTVNGADHWRENRA